MNRTKSARNINLASAENAVQAVGFADLIGLSLNRHLTVSWESAQCIGRVQDIQGRFLERFSKWIRYQGSLPVYVWSIENGYTLGYHSHIFCHVPRQHLKGFRSKLPKWIDGDVDQAGPVQTFKVTTIKYGAGVDRLNRLKGVTRYILKAANDDTAQMFNIVQRPDKAGIVTGKRLGTSQNIGRKARNDNLRKPEIGKAPMLTNVDILPDGESYVDQSAVKRLIEDLGGYFNRAKSP